MPRKEPNLYQKLQIKHLQTYCSKLELRIEGLTEGYGWHKNSIEATKMKHRDLYAMLEALRQTLDRLDVRIYALESQHKE